MKKAKVAILLSIPIFATAIFDSGAYADAANIDVNTPEQWYSALQTIHASSNSEFTITLGADVEINSNTTINNQAIDNGNTVTIVGNSHTLKFDIGDVDGRIRLSGGATLNLGKNDGTDTLTIKGQGEGDHNTSYSLITTSGSSTTLNIYKGTTLAENYSKTMHLVGAAIQATGTNGAINMYGGTIRDNAIMGGGYGGGIAMNEGSNNSFHMYDGEFINNITNELGGAIYSETSGNSIIIEKGTFTGNKGPETVGSGGAIYMISGKTTNVKNATFTNNVGVDGGGAISVFYSGSLSVDNCTFTGNKGSKGGENDSGYGAILAALNSNPTTIKNSTFTGNTGKNGSAIIFYGDSGSVSNSTFENNTATGGGTVRVLKSGSSSVTFDNNTFQGNKASSGGAIFSNAHITITENIFKNNTVANNGGAIYSTNTLTISDSTFTNNAAGYGGAIFGYGGFTLTSTNDNISENTADYAGGVYLGNGITADLSTSSVFNNKATSGANDYFLEDNIASVKIIPASNMTGIATYDDGKTTLKDWYDDADTQRYTVTNPTATVDTTTFAGGATYMLTAAGDGIFTVHFETNGGSAIADMEVNSGDTITAPTDPTKDGYEFKGWFTDAALTAEFDFATAITHNTTLYAKWESTTPEPGPTPPAPTPDPDPEPTPTPTPTPTPEPENPVTNDEIASYVLTFALSILGLGAACVIKR